MRRGDQTTQKPESHDMTSKRTGVLDDPLTARLATAQAQRINGGLWAAGVHLDDGTCLRALAAGRALDAVAAHQVLGWKVSEHHEQVGGVWTSGWELAGIPPGGKLRGIPKFSTTDAGLGEFLDLLRLEADEPFALDWTDGVWSARLWSLDEAPAVAGTSRAHAVVLAAVLRATDTHCGISAPGSDGDRSGNSESGERSGISRSADAPPAAPDPAESRPLSRRERKRLASRVAVEEPR
jgi:hypothetical protein